MTAKKPAAKKKAQTKAEEAKTEETPTVTTQPADPNEAAQGNDVTGQEPPLFEGTEDELDDNGETQADREAAGEARRRKVLNVDDPEDDDLVYEPERRELENAGFDHPGAEEQRQAELQAERDRHNSLTAGSARS